MSDFEVTLEDFFLYGIPESAKGDASDDDLRGFIRLALSDAYGYVGAQYPLPLPASDGTNLLNLTSAVCAIAAYKFLVHRRGFDFTSPADTGLKDSFDAAITFLRDVANARVRLDIPSSVVRSAPGARVYQRPSRGW